MTSTTNKRPRVDTTMSESGDYGEPSASTVVLPDPPAWLNVDELMSYDDRQRIKDLIEEGRELLPDLASWGERVREEMCKYEELPDVVWEVAEIREALGIKALGDVGFVVGAMGNRAGKPGFDQLADLREEYPQYAEMLH